MADKTSTRPPTSVDVAQQAGLSRSAVSQILNGHGERFPAETRDRVMAAASDLGYRPSRVGRALVNGVTDFVVLVLPHTTFGSNLQDSVDTISARAAAVGLTAFIRYAGTDSSETVAAILDLRPTAVVDLSGFCEEDRNRLTAAGIALSPGTGGLGIEQLNYAVGRLQVQTLLQVHGRHLVYALFADSRTDLYGPQRLHGATATTRELGVAPPTVIRVPLDLDGAMSALSAVVTATASPLGICCYNDDVAIAILAAARELSLDVPEKVALVGADHNEIGQLMRPRLTSISYDLQPLLLSLVGKLGLPGTEPVVDTTDLGRLVTLAAGESA